MVGLLNRFTTTQLQLLLRCFVLLLCVGLAMRVLWPTAQKVMVEQQRASVMQSVVRRHADPGVEIDDLKAAVARLQQQVEGDLAGLPRQQLESFVIGRLQHISWRNEIEIRSVKPAAGEQVEQYSEHLFQVELSGGYFQQLGWLQDVNSELGFVVIKEYQVKVIDKDSQDPQLQARVLLAAYRLGSAA